MLVAWIREECPLALTFGTVNSRPKNGGVTLRVKAQPVSNVVVRRSVFPLGFALTDPGMRVSFARLLPEVTRVTSNEAKGSRQTAIKRLADIPGALPRGACESS